MRYNLVRIQIWWTKMYAWTGGTLIALCTVTNRPESRNNRRHGAAMMLIQPHGIGFNASFNSYTDRSRKKYYVYHGWFVVLRTVYYENKTNFVQACSALVEVDALGLFYIIFRLLVISYPYQAHWSAIWCIQIQHTGMFLMCHLSTFLPDVALCHHLADRRGHSDVANRSKF